MVTLPTTQTSAGGTYAAGVSLTSSGNNPFVFSGTIDALPSSGGSGGSYIGLYLYGNDTVTNAAIDWSLTNSGSITGGQYGVRVSAGSVRNTGVVVGDAGFAIGFLQTGTLVNSGTLTGQGGAYLGAGGSITNTGTIGTTIAGQGILIARGAGFVTNAANALVSGQQEGIGSSGAGVAVTNAGTIQTYGSSPGGAYHGFFSTQGGLFSNQAGGVVSSYGTAVAMQGAAGTVFNAGTLTSTGGGPSVQFAAGYANLLQVAPGAVFNGIADGGNALSSTPISTLELTKGAAAGTIAGFGSSFINFADVTVDPGAAWTLAGAVAAGAEIAFAAGGAGTLTLADPGAMQGTITGFGLTDLLTLDGVASNATFDTIGAGGTLTIHQASGPPITLNLVLQPPIQPATLNLADGTSLQYVYDPGGAPAETVIRYSQPNAAGSTISELVNETAGTADQVSESVSGGATNITFGALTGPSSLYVHDPTPAVLKTIGQYKGPNAGGGQISDIVNNRDGTTLVYAYNPLPATKQTTETWTATNADGTPGGRRISAVVDNSDGTALIYQYSPTPGVTLNETTFGTSNSDGSSSGGPLSDILDDADGASVLYAYNPSASIRQTAGFYSSTAADGAPAGMLTREVIDYTAGGSSVTLYGSGGAQTTTWYSGPDGAGTVTSRGAAAFASPIASSQSAPAISFIAGPPTTSARISLSSLAGKSAAAPELSGIGGFAAQVQTAGTAQALFDPASAIQPAALLINDPAPITQPSVLRLAAV